MSSSGGANTTAGISRRGVLSALGVGAAATAAAVAFPAAADAATMDPRQVVPGVPTAFPVTARTPASTVAATVDFDATSTSPNLAPFPPLMVSEQLYSRFTTDAMKVDGTLKPAYLASGSSRIAHVKDAAGTADATSSTFGILRSVWDGPVLYLHVEVHDDTPSRGAATDTGLVQDSANDPSIRDSVVFSLDFWNDKVDKLEDDDGLFTVSSNGNLTYVLDTSILEFSSVHADPNNAEYTDRIKAWAAMDTDVGYNVELALQIEGAFLENGTKFGIDVVISDSPAFGTSRTNYVFWSHNDNTYPVLDQGNNADWGTVTLAGWDGTTPFKFSNWPLRNTIRWLGSLSFQQGVWTPQSQAVLTSALAAANAGVNSTDQPVINELTVNLVNAVLGLRWGDTRFPDPATLPSLFTLPDPWTFFDGRPVRTKNDWFGKDGRREELLNLAQFYEYGFFPPAPDSLTITSVTPVAAVAGASPAPASFNITASITYGTTTAPITFQIFPPTNPLHGSPAPVVVVFQPFPGSSGFIPVYSAAGYAILSIPADVTTDDRNMPWVTRTGTFRTFFPYTRNGKAALNESGNEIGAAWGVSRGIDALEVLAKSGSHFGTGTNMLADPTKVAVTGLSIDGKYAFVSALFDERIGVCVPNAAGATGPSPWRYLSVGHIYSFGQSNGTEAMGDNIRLNAGRANTLFRKFLTPGRFYKNLSGSWGYGDRLPFDQHELIGTLAPRAIVTCDTVNDYGDGSEEDPLGCEIAKFIYATLGFDADDLVKFNVRPFNADDPHDEDAPQEMRTAAYLDHYFFKAAIPADTDAFLNDDPFDDEGTLNENAYNRYFGGYETIAPWRNVKLEG